MPVVNPVPAELTRDDVQDLRNRYAAGANPVMYVLRDGAPTWVTVSVEGVIANIPAETVEPDPEGGWRLVNV